MTTTIADIITGTLRKLGVLDIAEEPEANEAAEALDAFNEMVASWELKGVNTGVSELTADDEFPFVAGHVGGVKALLAVYLAPGYGKSVSAETQMQAMDGWLALQSDYGVLEELTMDGGLQGMPSQRRCN